MEKVSNIGLGGRETSSTQPLIDNFEDFLKAEKVSKNTIKNYLSDIRQFINWLEDTHAQIA